MIFAPGFVAWTPVTPVNKTPRTTAAATKTARRRKNPNFFIENPSPIAVYKSRDPLAWHGQGSGAALLLAALYPPQGGFAITRTGR